MVSEDSSTPHRGNGLAKGDLGRLVSSYHRASQWRQDAAVLVGEGRGRLVIAKVDATGVLIDLDVPDAACTGDGQVLAQDVTRALTAARRDVATRLVESGERTFGADDPLVGTIRDAAEARSEARIEIDVDETASSVESPAASASPSRPTDPTSGSFGQW